MIATKPESISHLYVTGGRINRPLWREMRPEFREDVASASIDAPRWIPAGYVQSGTIYRMMQGLQHRT